MGHFTAGSSSEGGDGLGQSGLIPGSSVKIHSLRGSSELNGMHGICERLLETGRWQVRIGSLACQAEGGNVKALKPENLELLRDDDLQESFISMMVFICKYTSTQLRKLDAQLHGPVAVQSALQTLVLPSFIERGRETWHLANNERDVQLEDQFVASIIAFLADHSFTCHWILRTELLRTLTILTSVESNSFQSAARTCMQCAQDPRRLSSLVKQSLDHASEEEEEELTANSSAAKRGELASLALELMCDVCKELAPDECKSLSPDDGLRTEKWLAKVLVSDDLATQIAECLAAQTFRNLRARTHAWLVLAGAVRASSTFRLELFGRVVSAISQLADDIPARDKQTNARNTNLMTPPSCIDIVTAELRAATTFIADLTRAACRDGGWKYTSEDVRHIKGVSHSIKPSASVYRGLVECGVVGCLHRLMQSLDAVVVQMALRALSDMTRLEVCRLQLFQAPAAQELYCKVFAEHSDPVCAGQCGLLLSHLLWGKEWQECLSEEQKASTLLQAAKCRLDWCREGAHDIPLLQPGCVAKYWGTVEEDGTCIDSCEAEGDVAGHVLIFLTMFGRVLRGSAWPQKILDAGLLAAVLPFVDSPVGPDKRQFDQQKGALGFIQNTFVCDNVPVSLLMQSLRNWSPEDVIYRISSNLTLRAFMQSKKFANELPSSGVMKLAARMTEDDGGVSRVLYECASTVLGYLVQDPCAMLAARRLVAKLRSRIQSSTCGKIDVGCYVRLHGLVGDRAAMNGCCGTVQEWCRKKKMWQVCADDGPIGLVEDGLLELVDTRILLDAECCAQRVDMLDSILRAAVNEGKTFSEAVDAPSQGDTSSKDERAVVRGSKLADVANIDEVSIRRCNYCQKLEERKRQFVDTPGAGKCSRCLRVYYCSKECQVKDWENHKTICKALKRQ
eukprot:TRINITY_DN48007_c0_g1_i1.p1 TRINITY_DN48007_c0_g1~~TRINITY_DN48007_c0_g1_i1.p1  ORF type:complete len:987 (-),score=166.43 TRINITY_DN48007_c0_g1_i1:47-2764(-)